MKPGITQVEIPVGPPPILFFDTGEKGLRSRATTTFEMCQTVEFRVNSSAMALCYFDVGRIVPGEYHSYGHFVIDAPYTRQDEILAVLSDNDKSKIGFHLGITPAWEKMPADIQFQLSVMAANPMDLPPTPTFMSEAGYRIWITPQDGTIKL